MITIIASNVDDAYDEALSTYREDILEEMIEQNTSILYVEFGVCRPYEYRGCEDCEYQEIGEIEISLDDLEPTGEELNKFKGEEE